MTKKASGFTIEAPEINHFKSPLHLSNKTGDGIVDYENNIFM